jgi:plasmid stabilization system protein ParE
MELRWTEEAAVDLERVTDYLFEHAPGRAADLVREIYNAPAALLTFPNRGRPGKKAGTRELVLSPCRTLWSIKPPAMSSTLPVSCTGRRNGLRPRC